MLSKPPQEKSLAQMLKGQAQVLGGLTGVFWVLEVVDQFLFRGNLDVFGIHPWDVNSLANIWFAPFLHVGFAHLIANTVPFLVLGWLIMARSLKDFWLVLLISTVVSGLGVWLTSPPNTVHLGASGVIFGFLGFLLLRGYFERSAKSIVIALLVGFFFGSALWGVLPLQSGVSWQGHLFGFVGGGIAARLLSDRRKTA